MSDRVPQKPPSALDGYARLARTRAAMRGRADEEGAVSRRPRSQRIVGALRLVGFVAVLAMIVGTSVGLASADPSSSSSKPQRRAAAAAPVVDEAIAERDVEPVAREATAATEADDEPVAVEATTAVAPESAAAAPTTDAALPFTGPNDIDLMLLGGAVLVFLGMLVQIAGQPLPAHAARRTR